MCPGRARSAPILREGTHVAHDESASALKVSAPRPFAVLGHPRPPKDGELVALAQEQFPDSLEDEGASATSASEGAPESAQTRAVRDSDSDDSDGKLARAVDDLRAAEDAMRATLATVQRVLHRIEARRVHEDAGFATCSEFEQRMLAWAPLVRVMRDASGRPRPVCPQVTDERRDPGEDRTRSVKALTAIARALTRIRSLEAEMHQSALHARATLDHVEAARLFEECGYASYEEFLERAVGPSPILGCAMATLALDVSHESAEPPQEVSEDELLPDTGDDIPGAFSMSDAQPSTGEAEPMPPLVISPLTAAPTVQATGGGSSRRLVALSLVAVLVCGVAGLGGAYAGASQIVPPEQVSPEAGAPVREVASAPVTHLPKTAPKKVLSVRNAKEIQDALEKQQ